MGVYQVYTFNGATKVMVTQIDVDGWGRQELLQMLLNKNGTD